MDEKEKVVTETQEEVVAPQSKDVELDEEELEEEDVEQQSDEEEAEEMTDADEEDEGDDEEEEEGKENEEESPAPEPEPEAPKPVQSAEDNARYAAARRASEARERGNRKKLENIVRQSGFESYEELMSSNGLTPAEEKKLRAEAEEYGYNVDEYISEHIDKKYVKFLRSKDEAERLKAEADKEQAERVRGDIEAFKKTYPSISVDEILSNQRFMKFAKGKTQTQSLLEIYGDYIEVIGETTQIVARSVVSKAQRSTGSSSSSSTALNPRQRAMMKEWNARYPDRKLTAEDFIDEKK